jgi:hypothetical protein
MLTAASVNSEEPRRGFGPSRSCNDANFATLRRSSSKRPRWAATRNTSLRVRSLHSSSARSDSRTSSPPKARLPGRPCVVLEPAQFTLDEAACGATVEIAIQGSRPFAERLPATPVAPSSCGQGRGVEHCFPHLRRSAARPPPVRPPQRVVRLHRPPGSPGESLLLGVAASGDLPSAIALPGRVTLSPMQMPARPATLPAWRS